MRIKPEPYISLQIGFEDPFKEFRARYADLICMDLVELKQIHPEHEDIPKLREYYKELFKVCLDRFLGLVTTEVSNFEINKALREGIREAVELGRMHPKMLDCSYYAALNRLPEFSLCGDLTINFCEGLEPYLKD